jgi:hypothetical protein
VRGMADEPSDQGRQYELHGEPGRVSVTGDAIGTEVTRGLTEIRLAVLGILVAVALGSAALAYDWWQRLAVGFGAFGVCCALIRWPRSRNRLMKFAHWLTGL